MAKIIIRWNPALIGAACKFDVYLKNTYIGELKCGSTLETSADVGSHILSFKKKGILGKKADTSFVAVVNDEEEVIELKTKFDTNGNFIVKYADNAPHIPIYADAQTESNMNFSADVNGTNSNSSTKEKKKRSGCLVGCLTVLLIIIAINIFFAILTGNYDSSNDKTQSHTEQSEEQKENVLYSDENFKITFVDFNDPHLGVTSYTLLLKIENNSDKTVIVAPSDGYANDEAVFLGSGLPVKVKPNKKVTGAFVVGYGTTSIQSIDEIKTLELKMSFYNEDFSENILTTDDIIINLE